MRCWHSCLSGARCKWFAYGPSDATATPSSLALLIIQIGFTFLVPVYTGCLAKGDVKLVSVCVLYKYMSSAVSGCKTTAVARWQHQYDVIDSSYEVWLIIFGRCVCKTVRPMLSDRCLSVCILSVTLVYCGQTVGQIKMKVGVQVGLGPGHILLDGDHAPTPQRGTAPNFWPMSILAKQLHGSRCHWYGGRPQPRRHCGRWGPSSPYPNGARPPQFFGPCLCLLWPNGWMDKDATWYEGRPWRRPHCVTWGPSSPTKRVQPPNFWPMSIVAKRWPISATAELLLVRDIVSTTDDRVLCCIILQVKVPLK